MSEGKTSGVFVRDPQIMYIHSAKMISENLRRVYICLDLLGILLNITILRVCCEQQNGTYVTG